MDVNTIWNSIPLEERLELGSKAYANAAAGSLGFFLLSLVLGYAVDAIWMFPTGLLMSFVLLPYFASYAWRVYKPKIILSYLAVRAMARRYAYANRFNDMNVVFTYRGQMQEILPNIGTFEDGEKQTAALSDPKDVWIVLFPAGLILLTERIGGAKLEFATKLSPESAIGEAGANFDVPRGTARIDGVGKENGRSILISSDTPAAHHVFKKRTAQAIDATFGALQKKMNHLAQAKANS